ncbi:hypothetical protein [Paraflavitalea speifideaquila]|nr:hypothetical protein [Paraflavitalea speifideiaquila]
MMLLVQVGIIVSCLAQTPADYNFKVPDFIPPSPMRLPWLKQAW